MGEESVQGSGGKARRKRPLGRPRRRWEGGIRIDLREIGWGSVEWTQLAQNIVNMVMNLRVLAPRNYNYSLLVGLKNFNKITDACLELFNG
jgi:hypothetical protein